jgi:hypothetical protein
VIDALDRVRRFIHSCEKGVGAEVIQRRKSVPIRPANRIKEPDSPRQTLPIRQPDNQKPTRRKGKSTK